MKADKIIINVNCINVNFTIPTEVVKIITALIGLLIASYYCPDLLPTIIRSVFSSTFLG